MRESAPGVQTRVLESLEGALNYNRWLADLLDPWLGDDLIEVGAGTGSIGRHWVRPARRVTVTEPDAARVALLQQRFDGVDGVQVHRVSLPTSADGTYSGAAAVNVIEHLEDDVAAVASMAGLVRPGGHVALIVPAFPLAMSRFDREIGHHRRYRTAGVRALLTRAALEPVRVQYVNSLGLLGWTVVVRGLRRSPTDGALLRFYDRRVVPSLRRWEEKHHPPFGQSVLGIGRVSPHGRD